jgi:undecaprenyl diphosphate synthase
MLKRFLRGELKNAHKNNIRFRAIGDLTALSGDIQQEIEDAMALTTNNTGLNLVVALNYGGRAEIVRACRRAAAQAVAANRSVNSIDELDIERNLYTHGLPEVDLLIRTSGELRISNFLLWQIAYSEIYVTPTLFPDFRRPEIFEAILEFQKRERRFGDVTPAGKAVRHA